MFRVNFQVDSIYNSETLYWACKRPQNETLLLEGLSKIKNIKTKLNDIAIRIDNQNCEDLTLIFDLQSSLSVWPFPFFSKKCNKTTP